MIERIKSYQRLLSEADQLEDQIKMLETKLYHPSAPKITGMPRGGQVDETDIIIKKLELQEKLKQKLIEIIDVTEQINAMLDKIPLTERQVLRCRYVFGMTIRQTAYELNYSERQIVNLTKQGFRAIKKAPD